MIYLPVCLNITDMEILIIGGGKVALQKIESLLRYTDKITVLSEKISGEIEGLNLKIIVKSYMRDDLRNFKLVFACTNDFEINKKIKQDAEKLGILVNVCDIPILCDFTMPAVYKKDKMSIAVSSNGEDVKKSVLWRNKIKEIFENDNS